MPNAKLVIIAVFVLTLGGGVVTGMLISHIPAEPKGTVLPTTMTVPKTPMEQELDLNPSQQQQMQAIWDQVRQTADDCYIQAQDLQKRQWETLVNILTD